MPRGNTFPEDLPGEAMSRVFHASSLRPEEKVVDGRYVVLRQVGSGGSADVYEAIDEFGQTVALKLWKQPASPGLIFRMRAEMERMAEVDTPLAPRIVRTGSDERDHPFIAMTYIEGRDLSNFVLEEKLKPKALANLMSHAATSVHAVHRFGVVHRDVKPANLIVDHDGRVRVVDYGLAVLESDGHRVGKAGTPQFWAPEQSDRSRGPITVSTDVYAIGSSLEYLLDKRGINPPKRLKMILARATSEDPEQRHDSAQHLGEDLAAYAVGQPISWMKGQFFRRVWCGFKRNKVASFLLASIGVLSVFTATTVVQNAAFVGIATWIVTEYDGYENDPFWAYQGIQGMSLVELVAMAKRNDDLLAMTNEMRLRMAKTVLDSAFNVSLLDEDEAIEEAVQVLRDASERQRKVKDVLDRVERYNRRISDAANVSGNGEGSPEVAETSEGHR